MGRFTAVAMEGFKALCVSRSQAWIVLLLRKGKRKGRLPVLINYCCLLAFLPGIPPQCTKTQGENLKTTGFILYYKLTWHQADGLVTGSFGVLALWSTEHQR